MSENKSDVLRIYLADPVHNFVPSSDIWTIPLNVLTIAEYTKAAFGGRVDISVFKFPDLLLEAIEDNPPDILGVSNYIWNFELSSFILKRAKKKNPETITVMGGPNVFENEDWMSSLFKRVELDYYVPQAGEDPFKSLVGAMLDSGVKKSLVHEDDGVHGVWFYEEKTSKASFKPIKYIIKNLDEIPSPFKSGLADPFLEQGLMPMVETHRGCPFPCTFCDWGDATLGKVYKYSVERMMQDIEYCRHTAVDERFMIDDANFGLLGKRDLELARFIRDLRDEHGWPGKLIITWGQSKSDVVLEIAETLKDLCMMTQSSQSMNPEVLKNIKRKNISNEAWEKSTQFCKDNGIDSYGELMIPLPGETFASYISAVRYLFSLGVDFINVNPLILLNGAEMNTSEQREMFKMDTRWRLLENCYGVYDGETVIESQEMVLATNTFTEEEYLLCRTLSWLLQMSWNLRRHDLLLRFMSSVGVSPVDFLIRAINGHEDAPEKVRQIFKDFLRDEKDEFYSSREALIDASSTVSQIEVLRNGGFRKLNTYYAGRVSLECSNEFLEYFESIAYKFVETLSTDEPGIKDMVHDCVQLTRERFLSEDEIFSVNEGRDVSKNLKFAYDVLSWDDGSNERPLSEFYRPEGVFYQLRLDDEQKKALKEHLQRFSGMDRGYQLRKLQEPFHGIHKKHLLYRVKALEDCVV